MIDLVLGIDKKNLCRQAGIVKTKFFKKRKHLMERILCKSRPRKAVPKILLAFPIWTAGQFPCEPALHSVRHFILFKDTILIVALCENKKNLAEKIYSYTQKCLRSLTKTIKEKNGPKSSYKRLRELYILTLYCWGSLKPIKQRAHYSRSYAINFLPVARNYNRFTKH